MPESTSNPFPWGAVATGASGVLGAAATMYAASQNSKHVRYANDTNVRLAREQNEFNEYMWNQSNEYNSPVNQLKLLKEAGLNPNFYGQNLTANSGSQALQSANLANQVADTTSAPLMAQGVNSFLQSQESALNYMLQSRALDIEDKKADIQAQLAGYQGRLTSMQEANSEMNRKQIQANIDQLEKTGRYTEAQIRNLDQMTANAVTSQKEAEQRISLLAEQIEGAKTSNQRSALAYKIEQATANAQIKSMWLDVGMKETQIKKMNQEIQNFILDGKRKEFEIDIAGITASIKRTENGQMIYNLEMDKKYGDSERKQALQLKAAQTANEYINGICKVAETGANLIKSGFDIAEKASPLGIAKSIANP